MLSFIQQMIFFAWYLIPTPFLKLTCGIYSGFFCKGFCRIFLAVQNNHWNLKLFYDKPSQQTFILKKTSWRCLSSSSSKDVLIKTNIFSLLVHLQKTSTRCNMFVLVIRPQNVFETFSRRLQDIFKTRNFQDVLLRRLQDTFKTSLRTKTSLRHF